MREIMWIAVAGAGGAVARYAVSGWAQNLFGVKFPWGTFIVNIVGCIAIGLLMHVSINSTLIPNTARLAVGVGFLGAFTTYSTFGYETVRYLEDGAWMQAGLSVGANLVFGVVAVMLGFWFGRLLLGGS